MPATYQPFADREAAMRVVHILVAERTPDAVLVYFASGPSAVMAAADFDARYAPMAPC